MFRTIVLNLPGVQDPSRDAFSVPRTLLRVMLFGLLCLWVQTDISAQAPTVSYSSPQVFPLNSAISNLSPTATNVPAQTFRNVTTYAGTGSGGSSNNSNPLLATFDDIVSMVMDARGNIYLAELSGGRSRIRRIAANGGAVVTLMDLNPTNYRVWGLAINGSTGDLYFTVTQHAIYRIPNTNSSNYPSQDPVYSSPSDATIESNNRMAGLRGTSGNGDNTTGTTARFNTPLGMDVDAANGFLYVADKDNSRIRKISLTSPFAVETVSTSGVTISQPEDVVVDAAGVMYATSVSADVVYRIGTNGVVTNFAGSGTAGYLDGQGTAARFSDPRGIDMDAAGNLYVADGSGSHGIRKITPGGYVSTLAGSGTGLSGTTEGVGTSARFNVPHDVIVDRTNSLLFVGDNINDKVREVEIGGYTVSPSLPDGLSLNAVTGVISGTPTVRSRQVYYSDDFDDAAGGTGTSIAGSAAYVGGWMRLTDALANGSAAQDGAFRVDASGVNTNGLQVDFRFINGKTSDGADGMSYSFAPDATTTGGSNVSLGTGTGLSLSFSTWSGNTIKMNLYYGSGRNHSTSVSGTLLASNTSNNALWLGRTANISLTIDNDGKVTVKVDGTTVFNQVQLPAGYTSANKSTWYHVFRASTGFLSDVYAIDDLIIRQQAGAQNHTVTAYNSSGTGTATVNINTGIAPVVSSTATSSVAATTATGGGNVTTEGDASVTARGVVWSTSVNPTVALSTKTTDGTGAGSFTSSITGLSSNTTYYYRAYATNIFGTVYGTETSFKTSQAAPNISFGSSTVTLALGTPASISLVNSGGQPELSVVTPFAGNPNGTRGSTDDLNSVLASFFNPGPVVFSGSVFYIGDVLNHNIRRIDAVTGSVATFAGASAFGFSNGIGTAARFKNPQGLALDGQGNLYVADEQNHVIRKIDLSSGFVSVLAGTGTPGSTNGTASTATFREPRGLAYDGARYLYVADALNDLIRRIDLQNLTSASAVTTVAGGPFFASVDGVGTNAGFRRPTEIVLDGNGVMYVSERVSGRIRKIVMSTWTVTTLAGSSPGFKDGIGTEAMFDVPEKMTLDGSGNLYVVDSRNNRIRKIELATAKVTTIAGSSFGNVDGVGTNARFWLPIGICFDGEGNLIIGSGSNNRIRKISRYSISPGLPAGLIFNSNTGSISGTPTQSLAARLYTVTAHNEAGSSTAEITIAVASAPTVTTNAASNVLSTSATLNATVNANGSPTTALSLKYSTVKADVDAGLGTEATVSPTSVSGSTNTSVSAAVTGLSAGTTYYFRVSATNSAGTSNGATLSFTTTAAAPAISYSLPSLSLSVGAATTTLTPTNSGGAIEPMQVSTLVGGGGNSPSFNSPSGITTDGIGNLYVTEHFSNRIRKVVIATREVSTLAGGSGSGTTDGPVATAKFNSPYDIASYGSGILYVADFNTHRIRKIDLTNGLVSTIAGPDGPTIEFGVVDATGNLARFSRPRGIAVDGSGNMYVADMFANRIRKITPAGEVSTYAGSTSGDTDGPVNLAKFNFVTEITVDQSNNVYVTQGNHRIRKITPTGEVSTLAGTGYPLPFSDGSGTSASFNAPSGMTVDGNGNIYVADMRNNVIRKITPSGMVTTLAGSPGPGSYADGAGALAKFNAPADITMDGNGSLFVTDQRNHRIRMITNYAISPALPAGLSFNSATGAITGTPTALSAATTYTVTASNAGGTSTATFTLEVSSSLLTTDVSAITETSASSGGTVDANYTGVTERGIVYSTATDPSITDVNDTKLADAAATAGTFSSALTGLTPNTTYYVRSYVVHTGGTDYGTQKTFKTNQLGTFADITKTYGDANFSVTAPTALSTGAFSYGSSDPAVATISGSTVTITGTGTATITATQAAAGAYASIQKTLTLTVNKATPIITLNVPSTAPLNTVTGANTITVSGTSSDGQTVILSILSGGASGTLTATGTPGEYTLSNVSSTGTITLQGAVSGTGNYAAATKQAALDVEKSNQTITFNALSAVTYTTGLTQPLTATSSSSLAVSYTVVSGPGSVAGTTLTITGPGSIVIKASQAGDGTYNPAPDVERKLIVNPGAPIVSSFTPASATEGDVVTITGQYFENVSAVKFGNTAATSFTVVNSTTITAVVSTGSTGAVSVTTTGGSDSKGGFRYKVLWTGSTNAFNNAANWTGNRVPQTDDDIVFDPNAASDLELDGEKTVGNVDFNGSSRSLKLGSNNLIVKGNVTMPGNITGSGKVIMRGSSAQTITGGGRIPDLEIDNASGVNIDASGDELEVTGVLRSTSGTLNANGKLRLASSSGGTARVGVVGGSITGNVIAERFVQRNNNTDGTGRAWRLVSIPVTGTGTLRDFFMNGRNGQDLTDATAVSGESENAGTPIVGHGYADAAAATAAGFDWIGVANMVSSLRYYSGDAGGGAFNSDQVPSLSTTYTAADQGYMAFTRGDRKLNFPDANSSSATTFRSTGTLKTGNQQVSVAPAATSKYTLVGNPYMSVLDLDAFYTTNSAVINPSFWIWEPNIAGTFKQGEYINVYKSGTEWVTNTGTYINPQLIESGVAFFVEPVSSLATATNITIMESHKSSETSAGLAPLSTEPKDERGRLFVKLQRADARGERQLIDGVALEFHKDLKETLGDAIDHEKLRNGISRGSLWVTNSGKSLSSEGRPWPALDSRKSIPLRMSNIGDQTLIVAIDPRGMNKPGLKVWLKDNSLRTEQEIDLSRVNEFDFIGTGSSAKDSTRFEIVYAQQPLPPVTFINTSAKKVASGVEIRWETPLDAGASYEIVRSADLESFATIHKQNAAGKASNSYSFTDTKPHPVVNYYRVVSKNATGQLWMSNWMRVNMSMKAGDWKLYPNPSAETKLQLELAEVKAGTYTVSVFDQQGRQVDQQRIEHGGGNRVHGLILPKRLTTGIYILQVTNARGEIEQTMKWMRE